MRLLDVCVRVRHNFIAWHQRQHLHHINDFKCKTCSISNEINYQKIALPNRVTNIAIVQPTLLSNLSILSQRFVNIVKKKNCFGRLDVSNVAISLLSLCSPTNTVTVIDDLLALSICIFNVNDATTKLNVEFTSRPISREDRIRTMQRFFNTEIPLNPNTSNAIFKMLLTDKFLPDMCISLMIRKTYNRSDLLQNLFDDCMNDPSFKLILSEHMMSLICITSHNCNAVLTIDNDYQLAFAVVCNSCNSDGISDGCLLDTVAGIIRPIQFAENDTLSDGYVECILRLVQSNQLRVRLNIVQCLPALCCRHSHVLCTTNNLYWTDIFNDIELAIDFKFLQVIPRIIDGINVNYKIFFVVLKLVK